MAKIPLREYIREIEEAINENQIEEAIAHCRYILKTYPKHVDTYRLLGKAYLESQRYNNAADVFQRVLSTIPNDFISHIGMSIIREDESNLDASIWHMERAFETQPYNTAIQNELRRLYGQRDGIEPPKIRMTRGALAHMYAKSNLYSQAIAEIRSNLSTEPNRADLQILLAQMYVKNGQTTEAIEVCSSLLQRFPYSLEANRLLSELLTDSDHEAETRTYRQRILDIDPYYAYISQQTPNLESVSDYAVTINKLDWTGGLAKKETAEQPAWIQPDIKKISKTDFSEDDLETWLAESAEETVVAEVSKVGSTEKEDVEIPDWIQEAGWEPSSGEFDEQESKIDYEEVVSDEEAIAGEIPTWLQGLAPEELNEDEKIDVDQIKVQDDSIFSLVNDDFDVESENVESEEFKTSPESSYSTQESKEPAKLEAVEEPQWLSNLGKNQEEGELQEEEIPEWLSGFEEETSDQIVAPEDMEEKAYSDREQQMEIADEVISEPLMTEDISLDSTEPEQLEAEDLEVPEWIQDLEPGITKPDEELEAEASDITRWLENLEPEVPSPDPTLELEEQTSTPVPEGPVQFDDTVSVSKSEVESEPEKQIEAITGSEVEFQSEEVELEKDEEFIFEQEPTDLPEWLSSMSQDGDTEIPSDLPEWIPETEGLEHVSEPESLDSVTSEDLESESVAPEMLPEIVEMDLAVEREEETESPVHGESEEVPEPTDLPEWVGELHIDDTERDIEEITEEPLFFEEASEAEPSDLPEWLMELKDDEETFPSENVPEEMIPLDERVIQEDLEVAASELTLEPVSLEETFEVEQEDEMEVIFKPEETPVAEDLPLPEDIPEWLLAVEEPETETVEGGKLQAEEPLDLPEVQPDDQKTEIPEWLEPSGDSSQDLFPSGVTGWLEDFDEEEVTKAEIDFSAGELPSWLEDIGGIGKTEEIEKAAELESEETFQVPESTEKVEEAVTAEEESETEYDDLNEAMAWLESLAAKSGVPEEELVTKPEYRPEEPPEWLKAVPESEDTPEEIDDEELPSEEIEELPDWISEPVKSDTAKVEDVEALFGEIATGEKVPEELEFENPEAAITWLESIAEHGESAVGEEEMSLDVGEGKSEAEEEMALETTQAESVSPTSETTEFTAKSTEEKTKESDLPDWILRRIEAESSDGEAQGELQIEIDESVDQVKIEEASTIEPDQSQQPETAPEDEYQSLRTNALSDFDNGEITEGIKKYDVLINKGKLIEDVIQNLDQVNLSNISEEESILILQLLGDAYMKADKIQEALDAYTEAEKINR